MAGGSSEHGLLPGMANRHGLITGATGTGKTITLRVLAEKFSEIGVPVFMADVKGDISGMAMAGSLNPRIDQRLKLLKLDNHVFRGFPVEFWDLLGEQGLPIRTTVSEMGPLLLSRLLNLNETQSGVLNLVFKVADDSGLLLLDLKDLRAIVQHIGENSEKYRLQYGNVSGASIGAIQRNLLVLQEQGGEKFFGEPALVLEDLLQTDARGMGVINILSAQTLIHSPQLYSTFLLWLLAELFEQLPEAGDPEKPRLIFFFDEAHLLFNDAPKVLTDKIEQVVRLIRSKGVGVYFITQNPLDLPDIVLGQLGNRFQHALRAFTPRDQRAVKSAAETFRPNPGIDVERAISELGVGEILISLLDADGRPTIVDRALVHPPKSQIPPLSVAEQKSVVDRSELAAIYRKNLDRESAYEMLQKKSVTNPSTLPSASERPVKETQSQAGELLEAFAKSAARSIGSTLGRQILRGILGSFGGTARRRK